jgi:hypothetical protein
LLRVGQTYYNSQISLNKIPLTLWWNLMFSFIQNSCQFRFDCTVVCYNLFVEYIKPNNSLNSMFNCVRTVALIIIQWLYSHVLY